MQDKPKADERLLSIMLGLFWTAQIVLFAVRSVNESWMSRFASLARRIPEGLFGAVLCWLMYLVLQRVARQDVSRRLLIVGGMSIPLGALFSVVNAWVIYATWGASGETCIGKACAAGVTTDLAIEYSVNFAFVFAAWGAICVGMLASAEAVAAERREGAARDAARLAQLRALHNQVNPHFLFNSLNSLGTLVEKGDKLAARGMIGEMGGFLRYGLAIDPLVDVQVDDEVDMQRRYLEIERFRFAHRLTVQIEVDEDLRIARLPPLIVQPLVENAIKHGVGTTSAPVLIRISVKRIGGGKMSIAVEDDAPVARRASTVTGVGLANVRDRLQARYDGHATLTTGPLSGAGYRAEIVMPVAFR